LFAEAVFQNTNVFPRDPKEVRHLSSSAQLRPLSFPHDC
jgi:hypothetical protein